MSGPLDLTTASESTPTSTSALPDPLTATVLHSGVPNDEWWRSAVIYQVYPRSWADSDGDGVGDLAGITARLPYLQQLGVDALWVSPFYVSPMNDAGYDVADYRNIDPQFGSLADAEALIARAHSLGLKIIIDLVPNHSSSEHVWFQQALAEEPGGEARARYLFRDGTGDDGSTPPNNWQSVFGGGAWSRVPDADGRPGQWYLHLFDQSQPDFDWTNPQVRNEFIEVLRFWLDRDVDGFRVDVAHGLVKADGLPDWNGDPEGRPSTLESAPSEAAATASQSADAATLSHKADGDLRPPMWDQDGVHDIYRDWRTVLNSYSPARILCAEAWVQPTSRLARYIRPDEMHQAFNFDFLETPWDAAKVVDVIARSYAANDDVDAATTWVLSNHDVVRHATRMGLASNDTTRPNAGIAASDPQPDRELGLRRARSATAMMLALPGSAYLYQGEELGLPDHTTMPHEFRQDPTYASTGGLEVGRDGCRVPIPWEADSPAFGFAGPHGSGKSWLPQPADYRAYAVDQQEGVPGSTLELYRQLLTVRRERGLGSGSLAVIGGLPDSVVGLLVTALDGTTTLSITNFSDDDVSLPAGLGTVLVSSVDLPDSEQVTVPGHATIWLG